MMELARTCSAQASCINVLPLHSCDTSITDDEADQITKQELYKGHLLVFQIINANASCMQKNKGNGTGKMED